MQLDKLVELLINWHERGLSKHLHVYRKLPIREIDETDSDRLCTSSISKTPEMIQLYKLRIDVPSDNLKVLALILELNAWLN